MITGSFPASVVEASAPFQAGAQGLGGREVDALGLKVEGDSTGLASVLDAVESVEHVFEDLARGRVSGLP